ncbi:MAG: ABC transporter substrate-binding protein, partial [bacterium]
GGDGWTATLASDPAADGLEWPSVFSPADTQIAARKFRHTFTTRYGHEPDAVSALGHDAALTVLEAIRRGGTTRTGVRDALAAPGLVVEGVTGPISFQRGDRIGRGGGLVRVRNGALTLDLRWADLLAP